MQEGGVIDFDKQAVVLGARVRSFRKEAGLTQADLASRMATVPAVISEIERGEGNPKLTTLFSICWALDLKPDALFQDS